MISIMHKQCGSIAFFYDHMPVPGEEFNVEHAFSVRGSPIEWHHSRLCPTCGRAMGLADFEPGPPVLRTFDMTSPQDMRSFYEDAGSDHMENIA
jgi:hypothetical protein